MSVNLIQMRDLVIRPVLEDMASWANQPSWASPEAVRIVLETGYVESDGYQAIRQYARRDGRRGPARGFWQCEPATHEAYWRWIKSKRLGRAVEATGGPEAGLDPLLWNMAYGALMCRIHYRRNPHAIPKDVPGRARMWKRYYNTSRGAGTVEKYVREVRLMDRKIARTRLS